MAIKKRNKIRIKATAGLKDLDSFYFNLEKFAKRNNFDMTHVKVKQRLDTPLFDGWYELTKLEDRKS